MTTIKIGSIREIPPNLKNGEPRYEIWINQSANEGIPFVYSSRVDINLVINNKNYSAGLRNTKKTTVVWICPNIKDELGNKIPLSRPLRQAGYLKNDRIKIEFDEHQATILSKVSAVETISNKVLLKSVGSSQHTDGVRINKEFHDIFNPPGSKFYVSRGNKREVKVEFNNKSFKAEYRYEGTKAANTYLQRIGFNKDLKDEFKAVFPSAKGFFNIRLGNDINHYIFSYESVDETKYISDLVDEIQKSRHDTRENRLKRLASAPVKAESFQVIAMAHKRNADVIVEVILRAKGKCEKCFADAPFLRKMNGSPYLEVHHKTPLSEDGNDTVENAIAVCPNCHRELHYG